MTVFSYNTQTTTEDDMSGEELLVDQDCSVIDAILKKEEKGYNDLGTTDPYLLSEWDYEKNSKWTPSNVSRNSMKVVWWKCGAGHSYRAKITDRTIEQKGCPQCEAEFQQALPQMLIMMNGSNLNLGLICRLIFEIERRSKLRPLVDRKFG